MSYLYFLFLPPVLGAIAFKTIWHREVNFAEMMANMSVALILVCVVYFSGLYSEMVDTQVLNGKVTSKQKERVSCSHSYQCNCTKYACGKSSTCTTCQTCYDHSHDFDWNADTTIGGFTIDRLDRQGLKEPPRWTAIKAGDPVSRTDAYVNYIKASPDSLFAFSRQLINDFKGAIPDYPAAVYDYYKVNRVIADGITIDSGKWNAALSEALKDVGPAKQVNAVVLLTKRPDRLYASAVRSAWLGGKKNDVVVVAGSPDGKSIQWVEVFSWSKTDLVNVKLRDAILELKVLDAGLFMAAIKQEIGAHFQRRPMSEYEYLKDVIEPPAWVLWFAFGLSFLCMIGLSVFFKNTDHFGLDRN